MRNNVIHNVFVKEEFAYISYYGEGMKIVDISDPTSPGEVGDFDLSPSGGSTTWGVFPYTSSGLIYVGNSTDGFYSARFDATYAGHVRGTIKDDITGEPISGVKVSVLESSSRLFFDTAGNYKYAAGKDSLTFSADAFGYFPDTTVVSLNARDTVIHDISLTELPKSSIEGIITDVVTGDPIAAEVILKLESDAAPDKDIKTFTDANGVFSFESVYISFENEVTYPYLVVLPEFPYTLDLAEGISINEGVATEINFELDNADILLYNGDIGDDYFEYYAEPIETLGVTFHFARKNSGDLLQASRMDELTYPVAIWYTGDIVNSVLSATDEDSIMSFLDAGGRIFLTGQNIVENLSPTSSLLTDYLNVSYGGESTTFVVRGVEGNVVTDGLALFALTGAGSAGNQSSLDILVPTGNGDSAMLYGITDETVAAVSVEDSQSGYKIFLTGFGFEGIVSGHVRFEEPISLLANVLTWFGLEDITGINDEVTSLPEEYILKQNYPNPFNPTTRIEYTLLSPGKVSLIIYNMLGEEVTRLVDGEMPAGEHTSIWNASILSSGIYFYRLQAGDIVRTRKMVLLK
ncbi:T9SS type A sorting domain-containing protein [candidate division TA06 bacterium]|nr:T9SS type A sorting domain-containing protein [candidate division TA06 bacterium]